LNSVAGKTSPRGEGLIAVDIGNSAIKWTTDSSEDASQRVIRRLSIDARNWVSQFLDAVDQHRRGRPAELRVASVNAKALASLRKELHQQGSAIGLRLIRGDDCPMETRVRYPDRLGIDRLLAAWRASRLAPGYWVAVVDAGSAITVDCVNPQGIFLGGSILPGISLQLESLGRGTDALGLALDLGDVGNATGQDASASATSDLVLPGTDTLSAIQAGVWLGTAAAIVGLVRETQRRVAGDDDSGESNRRLFLTGGDAARLAPLIELPHQLHENLVIEALLDGGLNAAAPKVRQH